MTNGTREWIASPLSHQTREYIMLAITEDDAFYAGYAQGWLDRMDMNWREIGQFVLFAIGKWNKEAIPDNRVEPVAGLKKWYDFTTRKVS